MTDIVKELRADAARIENGPYLSLKYLRERFSAAADEIERLRAATQWQPMDTAPRDGTLVLLRYADNDEPFIAAFGSDDEGEFWCIPDGRDIYASVVNGWAPLPKDGP